MASVFLRDWREGDVVRAADLSDLAAAIALLEAGGAGARGGAPAERRGGVAAGGDGPVEWPWQVVVQLGADGAELWCVPGRVLVGAGDEGYEFCELRGGLVRVEGFDAGLDEPQVVYVALEGEVRVREVLQGEVNDGAVEPMAASGEQWVGLDGASLRVFAVPVGTTLLEGPLRVWPVAVWTPGYEQPVTQLLWGDLSALELLGVCDDAGHVVWPADRSGAAAWGAAGHEAGMDVVCEADFSTERETIMGPLYAGLDADGALEFYLGDRPGAPYEGTGGYGDGDDGGGDGGSGGLDDDFEDVVVPELPDDDDSAPDPWNPPDDDEDEDVDPDDVKIAVQIGYEKGEGFSECTLVRRAGGYFWRLVLDEEFVRGCLMGVPVQSGITLAAGGSQQGVHAEVQMSLGESSAGSGGARITAGGELLFKGTQGQYGVPSRGHNIQLQLDVDVEVPGKKWYLSCRQLSDAGSWVKRTRSTGFTSFHVRAQEWWTWSVDVAALKAAAGNEMRKALAGRGVAATGACTSEDSAVDVVLSGSLAGMTATATLRGAE